MKSLDDILAKSDPKETLTQHADAVLEIWQQLKERYSEIIGNDDFWRDSFYAVLFHDFGKICDNFQETLNRERAFHDDERVRHEFFSGMFLFANNHKYYLKNPFPLVAVFSHHKAFNDNGFNEYVNRNRSLTAILDDDVIKQFLIYADNKATEYHVEKLTYNEKTSIYLNQSYKKLCLDYGGFYKHLKKESLISQEKRKLYIQFKALLNISDWTGSSKSRFLEKGVRYSESDLANQIIQKLLSEGKNEIAENFTFKKFQLASKTTKNVISIAPTGSGKTEAALLWASQKKDWERIIYLLPTRVTSNAIFDRLGEYFGYECVALVHSSARLYRKEQPDNAYDQKGYFREKNFFKNVNVCTVDQILTQGFNLGFWEVKTFHMIQAKVIIDEIHLYSPYTLGLIISSIKYLKDEFNVRFYIMTATMPTKLLKLLKETLEDVEIIRDQELLNESRNQFEIRDDTIDELIDEIKEAITEGKKTLVVVNSVDKAIQLYEDLKPTSEQAGKQIICYHSRFINKHRSKKEKEIFALDKANEGGVLIATQVVEVSLDIDFDILFTENAPIDAVIQRAGRVNRKRKKEGTKVIITKHFEISEKIYEESSILNNTYKEFKNRDRNFLTESELTEMVDLVYADMNVKENPGYIEGLYKYLKIQDYLNYIQDLTTDERVFTRENLDQKTVIPYCFMKDLINETDRDKITKHELSIRRYRYQSVIKDDGPFGSTFIDYPYSLEKGLEFNTNNELSDKVSYL